MEETLSLDNILEADEIENISKDLKHKTKVK